MSEEAQEMCEYLEEHNYISKNKSLSKQKELSIERAECIANKHNSLIEELQQENTQLKENWDKLEEYCKNYAYWVKDNVDMFKVWKTFHLVLDKMKELKESEVEYEIQENANKELIDVETREIQEIEDTASAENNVEDTTTEGPAF